MQITFDIKAGGAEQLGKKILPMVEALIACNLIWLQENEAPGLYSSGVVYKAEKRNREVWKDIPTILNDGFGDCEDLTAYLVSQYRYRGEAAEPYLETFPLENGDTYYHVLVRREDGSLEDPSKALGMEG